jgi:PhnB protein
MPSGYTTVAPWIVTHDTGRLLDFITAAFDGHELGRVPLEDGSIGHAEIRVGDTIVLAFDQRPGWPDLPSLLRVFVDDADATMSRAVGAGAQVITQPRTQAFGQRGGRVRHPFGNIWWISAVVEQVAPDEGMRRLSEPAYAEAMREAQDTLDRELCRIGDQCPPDPAAPRRYAVPRSVAAPGVAAPPANKEGELSHLGRRVAASVVAACLALTVSVWPATAGATSGRTAAAPSAGARPSQTKANVKCRRVSASLMRCSMTIRGGAGISGVVAMRITQGTAVLAIGHGRLKGGQATLTMRLRRPLTPGRYHVAMVITHATIKATMVLQLG